jgi:hypothetical protein
MDALGITRICAECGKTFYCTDGDITCSSKCADDYENYLDNSQ